MRPLKVDGLCRGGKQGGQEEAARERFIEESGKAGRAAMLAVRARAGSSTPGARHRTQDPAAAGGHRPTPMLAREL
jgi:hypothetical protein